MASTLPSHAGRVLTDAANVAFVDGVHVAVTVGAILAAISAVIVFRYLPHSLVASGAMTGPVGSLEEAAELGLGGVPPVFADAHADGEPASDPVLG